MFANNLKIAFQNIGKHKVVSFINIFGLGMGMAACFVILQFVVHELSYDRFHVNGDRIYQIQGYDFMEDRESVWTEFEGELAPYLKSTDPAIVNYVRVYEGFDALISNAAKPSGPRKKHSIAFADTSFFSVFTFPLLRGNAATVLSKPMTVVISERIAEQYFGDQDPVGQKLITKGKDWFFYDEKKKDEPSFKGQTELLEVSGVMKNMVSNSTLDYDLVSSVATGLKLDTAFSNPRYEVYLMLEPGKAPENVQRKIPAARKFLNGDGSSGELYGKNDKLRLQSLHTLHSGAYGSESTTVKVFF